MGTYIFMLIVIVVFCFLLVMLILSQNPKGGGLSGTFGGGGSQMFGVQRTNDFLDKSTWVLASCIALLIILSTVFVPRASTNILPGDGTTPQTEEKQNIPSTPEAQQVQPESTPEGE